MVRDHLGKLWFPLKLVLHQLYSTIHKQDPKCLCRWAGNPWLFFFGSIVLRLWKEHRKLLLCGNRDVWSLPWLNHLLLFSWRILRDSTPAVRKALPQPTAVEGYRSRATGRGRALPPQIDIFRSGTAYIMFEFVLATDPPSLCFFQGPMGVEALRYQIKLTVKTIFAWHI